MSALRILGTGARSGVQPSTIARAFREVIGEDGPDGEPLDWASVTFVHGDAPGFDKTAAALADILGMTVEAHPANGDPKGRNLHMVDLGADVCIACATRWASGTGHCARAARRAGIPTFDYGVSTRMEDRPKGST